MGKRLSKTKAGPGLGHLQALGISALTLIPKNTVTSWVLGSGLKLALRVLEALMSEDIFIILLSCYINIHLYSKKRTLKPTNP